MASIFISYDQRDLVFVQACVDLLSKNHVVFFYTTPPADRRSAQNSTDGTILFLTENSANSKFMLSEFEEARKLLSLGKFLIPVVSGNFKMPADVIGLRQVPFTNVNQVVKDIEQIIQSRFSENPKQPLYQQRSSPPPVPDISSVEGDPAEVLQRIERSSSQRSKVSIKKKSPVPKSKSTRNKSQKQTSCWFLKINEEEWGTLRVGEEAFYHSYEATQVQRPDYRNFEVVKKDEMIIAFGCNGLNSVVAIFQVLKSLHQDLSKGEVITMKVDRLVQPTIPLSSFQGKIDFVSKLNYALPQKLFPLDEELFKEIINSPASQSRFNESSHTDIPPDLPTADIKDQLGFEKDVAALASVIAYTQVQPPLAIGLFGNWGTGKSFFMNKLEKEIKRLSDLNSPDYCTKVIHIKFNSWHYSDSNLWASMITKIFEDIETQSAAKPDELESLFTNLNSSKELLDEANENARQVKGQIETLEAKQVELEKKIEKARVDLAQIGYWDIAKSVFKNSERIQGKLNDGIDKINFLKSDDLAQIQTNIDELNTEGGRLKETLKLAYSFRSPKLLFAIAIAAGAYFGLDWLIDWLAKRDIIAVADETISKILQWSALFLSQGIAFLRPAFKKVKQAQAFLLEIKTITDDEATKAFNVETATLKAELQSAQNQKTEIGTNIGALEAKKASVEEELKSIKSGKRLFKFIEGRVTDTRYTSSLGIISWVRKDFEELNRLLKQQHELRRREKDPNKVAAMEKLAADQKSGAFEMERIILYIDDLDRCEIPIVVKVLEAIHLLLAFPLFVVIVGVDPRWMHSALRTKYRDLLTSDGNAPTENGADRETFNAIVHGKPASSYDYLEKIFQIPLILKPVSNLGKKNLIRSQFVSDNANKDENADEDKNVNGEEREHTPDTNGEPPIQEKKQNDPPEPPENEPTDEEKPGPVDREAEGETETAARMERLNVSESEIQFMQAIGFLAGESPRNIKRYVNIYRIIRTHSQFEFLDQNVIEDYRAAMLLLGILNSVPNSSKDFFSALRSANSDLLFSEFVGTFIKNRDAAKNQKLKKQLSNGSRANGIDDDLLIRKLITAMATDPTLNNAGDLSLRKFKQNADLICRFSFRDVTG